MVQKKQILIVEDNPLNREILSEILSEEYQVLEAGNGMDALDILKRHKDSISLILLDVMMPVMDGYTFLDRVKEDAALSSIPIIVTTQSDSEGDEVSALAHGATDFVPKPYRPQVILHRVASLIKLRETAAMVNLFQYDRLTGLYSKEFFYRKVRETLDENPETEYTIVCSNIENFKLYNDIFGVKAGDRLLKDAGERFRFLAGERGVCGRYSADRFLCLQESKQERADREIFSGQPCRNESPQNPENVSLKWGIYEITDRSIPVEQMCDRALLAVDSIKGQYNQPFAIYDDTLRSKLLREEAITDAMESALSEGQFVVYYQPKYSLRENCMAGAEALVRWIHPEWGLMSPGEFIPLFEKNGFIPRLDQYIWEQVCFQMRDWRQKGYLPVPVSVNVSRADVYQPHMVESLMEIIQKYEIEPSDLHLEITESAYADDPGQIFGTVNQLRRMGFTIEMDDFGSGYSSLNMLNQMKLDILKLDLEFIRNELAKPAKQSILHYVIGMSHGMGLSVVAEGVETQEQLNRLREIECDYVQGYFFARPMPAVEFEELLKLQDTSRDVTSLQNMRHETTMRRVMVADEDDSYRAHVRREFEGQYDVIEATDAQTALTYIAEPGEETISAVILSMTLPEKGADRIMKVLRQNPALWSVPVLSIIPGADEIGELPLTLKTDDFLCRRHPASDLYRRVERLIVASEQRVREEILRNEANRDYMTGLLNRRGLHAAMDLLYAEDLPLAVYLFDLDNLKALNDTCGHEKGDRMILSFTEMLRSQTRSGDILCRYGGDEFVVILKHVGDETVALNKGASICRLFREKLSQDSLAAACSGGVALCGLDERPSEKLVERADQALYRAKEENKGGCYLWKKEIK
ncbi:MAG: EAL domain-containing protein [Anaerovoracaceae bacterium]